MKLLNNTKQKLKEDNICRGEIIKIIAKINIQKLIKLLKIINILCINRLVKIKLKMILI